MAHIGAGGKGGPSRTKAVDMVAAKAYISASVADPKVRKFLMVSYIASRKNYPPWWTDEDKKAADHVNQDVLPHYFQAKVEADEHLEALAKKRLDSGDKAFQAINLRPGTLTDKPGTGKVLLGKTPSRGGEHLVDYEVHEPRGLIHLDRSVSRRRGCGCVGTTFKGRCPRMVRLARRGQGHRPGDRRPCA